MSQKSYDLACDNWRTADMFRRQAETLLYNRLQFPLPMKDGERLEILEQLNFYMQHMESALDQLSQGAA